MMERTTPSTEINFGFLRKSEEKTGRQSADKKESRQSGFADDSGSDAEQFCETAKPSENEELRLPEKSSDKKGGKKKHRHHFLFGRIRFHKHKGKSTKTAVRDVNKGASASETTSWSATQMLSTSLVVQNALGEEMGAERHQGGDAGYETVIPQIADPGAQGIWKEDILSALKDERAVQEGEFGPPTMPNFEDIDGTWIKGTTTTMGLKCPTGETVIGHFYQGVSGIPFGQLAVYAGRSKLYNLFSFLLGQAGYSTRHVLSYFVKIVIQKYPHCFYVTDEHGKRISKRCLKKIAAARQTAQFVEKSEMVSELKLL